MTGPEAEPEPPANTTEQTESRDRVWKWPKNDPAEQRKYITTFIGVVVFATAVVGGGVRWLLSRRSDSPSEATKTQPSSQPASRTTLAIPPPPSVGLAIEGRNASRGDSWGPRVLDVDPTDRVEFRVSTTNLTDIPTPPLSLFFLSGGGVASYFTAGVHATTPNSPDVLGPKLRLDVYSGIGRFANQSVAEVDDSDKSLRELDVVIDDQGGSHDVASIIGRSTPYELGAIEPHGKTVVVIKGQFATPRTLGQLAGGGDSVAFRHVAAGSAKVRDPRAVDDFTTAGSAKRGDRLRFSVLLHNPEFQAHTFHLQLKIKPGRPSKAVLVTLDYAALPGSKGTVGRAIVNGSGDPIALRVLPGTTELWQGKTDCSVAGRDKALPDGIADGGLDLTIGGFVPHDPCRGAEHSRWLVFDAAVT